jgi:hypothetical protein
MSASLAPEPTNGLTSDQIESFVMRLRNLMTGDVLKRSDEWAVRALGLSGSAARQVLKAHRERE